MRDWGNGERGEKRGRGTGAEEVVLTLGDWPFADWAKKPGSTFSTSSAHWALFERRRARM